MLALSTLSAPATSSSGPSADLQLSFPDNRLLIDLCGEFDRNLTQIESTLSVQIIRRGNQLAVHGEARERAAEVLGSLYARLEAGKSVEAEDIEGAIRMRGSVEGTGVRAGDQIEMFGASSLEIGTRKKTVEPRTDAQKAYVQNLLKNELAFGIGPAGTGKTYLAVAVAVNRLINGHVDKIILSRPALRR